MPRRRKDAPPVSGGAAGSISVEIGDVTDTVYPRGVPKNEDGTLKTDTEISVGEAKHIGAVSPESAQVNRTRARITHRKQMGEPHVKFGSTDPFDVFDFVRTTWTGDRMSMHVTRSEPQPEHHYPPQSMNTFRSSREMYDWILRNCHKRSPSATYTIRFKDGSNGAERGRAYLNMPDTTEEEPTPTPPQQQPIYPGFPQGQGSMGGMGFPPGYYGNLGYPFQGFMGQPPQQQAPVQQPAPLPVVQQQPVFAPPMPPSENPEILRLQQMILQLQLQNAQVLGAANEAHRRAELQASMSPVAPPPPPVPPSYVPPPGYMLTPIQPQPSQAQAAAPQPLQPPPPPPPPAPNPMETFATAAAQVTGMAQTLQNTMKSFAGLAPQMANPSMPSPDEIPPPPPMEEESSPIKTVQVGSGGNTFGLPYVQDPMGQWRLDAMGAAATVLPRAVEGIKGIVESIGRVQREQAARQARAEWLAQQQGAGIQVQQQQQPPPPPAPEPLPEPEPPAPPPSSALVPADSLRSMWGS